MAFALAAAITISGCSSDRTGLFNEEPGGGGDSGGAGGVPGGGAGGAGATDSGGSSGHGGGAGEAACHALEAEPERLTTYVEFAIDASGSMEDGGKWGAMSTAFASAFRTYPSSVHAGATVFPGLPTTTRELCYAAKQNIPIAELDGAQEELFANLFLAHSPGGGSPTHAALRFGYAQLRDVAGGAPGLRVLVLITDGKANYSFGPSGAMGTDCVGDGTNRNPAYDGPLVEEVRGAAADGIYTFAVGLPGSEGSWNGYADVLSDIAREGGTAPAGCGEDDCHVDLSKGGADLDGWIASTVREIGPAVQSCTFPVPESDDHDADALVVEYDGTDGVETLPLAENCLTEPGYRVSPGYVHLCGETCDRSVYEGGTVTLKLPCR